MADDRYSVELLLTANNQIGAGVKGVTQDLNQMDAAFTRTGRSAAQTRNSFSQLQTIAQGVFASGIIASAASFTQQMNELGRQANAADAVFTQLGGSLDALRRATSYVVDDMTLMEGANRLLITGMAQSSEEAAQFLEIAVKLGGALGQDAASSIENFNAAILNMSYERLDTLGISAANVRAKVKELTDAGEDVQDAFRLAVLDEAANTFDRLGDAVDVGVTNLSRFQVAWNNLMQDIGQGINNVLNQAAGTVMMGVDLAGAVVTRAEDSARVYELASQMFDIPYDTQANGLIGGINPFTQEMLDAAREVLRQYDEAAAAAAAELTAGVMATDQAVADQAAATLAAQNQFRIDSSYGLGMNIGQNIFSRYNQAAGTHYGMIGDVQLFTPEEAQAIESSLEDLENAVDAARELHSQGIISDEQIAQLERGAAQAREMGQALIEGAEAYRNLTLSQVFGEGVGSTPLGTDLSSQFLEFMRGMEMPATDFAKLEDTILLASGQVTEASIVFRDQVLPLVQAIFESQGAGAAAEALANLETFLQDAALAGYTPEQIATMLPGQTGYVQVPGATMGAGDSFQFQIKPGDTPSYVAALLGISVEDVLRMTGAPDAYHMNYGFYNTAGASAPMYVPMNPYAMPGTIDPFGNVVGAGGFTPLIPGIGAYGDSDTATATDPFASMKDSTEKIVADLDEVSATLDAIDGKEVTVKLSLDTNAPAWLVQLLTAGGAEVIAGVVRDNGGTVPGTNPRGRPIPTSE